MLRTPVTHYKLCKVCCEKKTLSNACGKNNFCLIIHCDLVLYRQRSLFCFSVNSLNAACVT